MRIVKNNWLAISIKIILLLQVITFPIAQAETFPVLSFSSAVQMGQTNDPWLVRNLHQQKSIESKSFAVNLRPAPKVSLGIVNLPIDNMRFNQEGMTHFKVGISQVFSRGDTPALKAKQYQIMSHQFPFMRQDRKAKVEVLVGSLWLDIFRAQQSIQLIKRNKVLFEQLADIVQAGYSSAIGNARQQDIIQAQLELTRLEDKLLLLKQNQNKYKQQLSEWLNDYFVKGELSSLDNDKNNTFFSVEPVLPQLQLSNRIINHNPANNMQQSLLKALIHHPAVLALEKKISVNKINVELAKQKDKTQWGVNANYGYREDNNQLGLELSDLFSVGITFDIPWTNRRQNAKQVQSEIDSTSAAKTEKWLLLRDLIASFKSLTAQLKQIDKRLILYKQRLLPQVHEQAEAALTAYTSDEGSFSSVVRARIAELNAQLDELSINVEKQKLILQLSYFFKGTSNISAKSEALIGDTNE